MEKESRKKFRRELTLNFQQRYQNCSKNEKSMIIDEFVKIMGFHRKHAIRVLKIPAKAKPESRNASPNKVYDQAVVQALIIIWEASDRMCGKRLKAAIPIFLQTMQDNAHLKLDANLKKKLNSISAATIDRVLLPIRKRAKHRSYNKKKSAHKLKSKIPVKTFSDWNQEPPGYLEADFVVHSGGSLKGSPIHSFSFTDVYSGWVEVIPLLMREQNLVQQALKSLQKQLPIKILGFDTDNDSAFLNDTVFNYCKNNNIKQTRCRPYKKNDQAWIEQKNGSVIRRLIGYERYEGLKALKIMARLYSAARLYTNYFQPSFKLKEKVRIGSKVKRYYHAPKTPCERLLEYPGLDKSIADFLKHQRAKHDPTRLLYTIRQCQNMLVNSTKNINPTAEEKTSIEKFVKSLSTQNQNGEPRPTHRTKSIKKRNYRTRKDPFENVWEQAERWLEQNSNANAKSLLEWLNENHNNEFNAGQLRTLQRRVKQWRWEKAQILILPSCSDDLTNGVGNYAIS